MLLLLTIFVSVAATLAMTIRAIHSWRAADSLPVVVHLASLGARLRPNRAGDVNVIRAQLASAGWRDRRAVDVYAAIRILAIFVGLGLAMAIAPHISRPYAGLAVGFLLIGICALLPSRYIARRTRRRQRAISRCFPSTVDLLVVCMDAGLGLERALLRVGEEIGHTEPVLGDELTVMMHELNAGVSLSETARRLAGRICLEEVSTFCAVLEQASTLGVAVGPTLRDYAKSLRQRRLASLEEQAGKIGAMLTLPLTLCLLPAALLLMLTPVIVSTLALFGE